MSTVTTELVNVSTGKENKIVTVNRKFASNVRIQHNDIRTQSLHTVTEISINSASEYHFSRTLIRQKK